MFEGVAGENAAPRGTGNKALLDQKGFDDFFERIARFRQSGGDGFDAYRPTAIVFGDAG